VAPEIYILRVYRRTADQVRQIVGLIETPGGSLAASFTNLTELTAILEAPKKHLHRSEGAASTEAAQIKSYRQEIPKD